MSGPTLFFPYSQDKLDQVLKEQIETGVVQGIIGVGEFFPINDHSALSELFEMLGDSRF